MIEHVPVDEPVTLDDYEKYVTLRAHVERVRRSARRHAGSLEGRTVWMINSAREDGSTI